MNQNISDVVEAIKTYSTVPLRGVQVLANELADYLRSISGEPDLVLVLSRRLKDAFANVDGSSAAPGSAEDTQALRAQIGALTEHASGLEQKLAAEAKINQDAAADFLAQIANAAAKLEVSGAEVERLRQELAALKAAPPEAPAAPAEEASSGQAPATADLQPAA
jgi:hypothetical protein